MPTANATDLLVTPLAAAIPAPGVDVLVPTAPARPAVAVVKPSARTPRVTDAGRAAHRVVDSLTNRDCSAAFWLPPCSQPQTVRSMQHRTTSDMKAGQAEPWRVEHAGSAGDR